MRHREAHRHEAPTSNLTRSDGLLGPAALHCTPTGCASASCWQRTFAVGGYPREVGYGWLARLLSALPDLEVSMHVEPFPAELAAQRLQKQRARFESTRRLELERGSLTDLGVAAAAEDAHQLASRLARGESRLFRAGLYLTVTADNRERARPRRASGSAPFAPLSSSAASQPPSAPSTAGSPALPLGLDRLRLRRTFDSEALAASFPFAASEPPLEDEGCFYGLTDTGAPVVYDRFAQDNYNSVVLARTGAGKSYLAKLEALRLLYQDVQVFIVDPDDEYRRLCQQSAAPTSLSPEPTRSRSTRSTSRREARRRSPSGSSSSPS